MRNRQPGLCYRCGRWCAEGEGHFEKNPKGWRVQHADCAIKYRGTSHHFDPTVRVDFSFDKTQF